MRDIKFRAWNKITNNLHPFINTIGTWSFNFLNYDVFIWLEYTGSKDKNGKEIYEGDIVKMYDEDDRDTVCEVVFKNGGFIVEWDGNFVGGEADLTTVGWAIEEGIEIEVIGNIYENPELIKK